MSVRWGLETPCSSANTISSSFMLCICLWWSLTLKKCFIFFFCKMSKSNKRLYCWVNNYKQNSWDSAWYMRYWEKAGGHYSYYYWHHSFTQCKFQSLHLLILICLIQVANCFVQRLSHLDCHITVDAQEAEWQWILLNFLSLPHQLSR